MSRSIGSLPTRLRVRTRSVRNWKGCSPLRARATQWWCIAWDRLARNLDNLRLIVQKLTKRGVRIEFVKENLTFTGEDSPLANLMLSVMGAFAEFEQALIRERRREGIALAKQRGAYRGRKKSLSLEQAAQLRQRVQAGERKAPLAREFGISRETLYQYLRTED